MQQDRLVEESFDRVMKALNNFKEVCHSRDLVPAYVAYIVYLETGVKYEEEPIARIASMGPLSVIMDGIEELKMAFDVKDENSRINESLKADGKLEAEQPLVIMCRAVKK